MWRHVEIVLTDVSEESIASIFWVEDKKSASESAEQVQQSVAVCRLRQYLHGATSQKTAFFIVIAVKTSNLTQHAFLFSEQLKLY
jgi:hypothetical protein